MSCFAEVCFAKLVLEELMGLRMVGKSALTGETFELLLNCLGADRDRAALRYRDLHRALAAFFAQRGADSPYDLADETMNRVARRLGEGQRITAANMSSYFYAVARNVLRETWASPYTRVPLEDSVSYGRVRPQTPDDVLLQKQQRQAEGARLHCLDRCLQKLSPADRELIIAYYQGSGATKIENRHALAARYGMTLKALRNKTSRLRAQLAECVSRCQKRR
jgi:DNA-directed RNA polymerase specialized sigma24 family protein